MPKLNSAFQVRAVQDIIKKEEETLAYWKEHKINEKVRERNANGKKFYFLDGPPFVTGELHLGHVWVKAYKDMVVRYKRTRGFNVVDRAGYDTQGLPAERLIEKKLNIKSKQEIEETIGIENFIKACKTEIDYYIGKWKNDFERFGVSLDFSHPYLPHSNEYMEGEWALFKTIDDRGYLYSGRKTTPYCPQCQCVVSQGSMEVEHSNEKDPSIFITFKVNAAKSKKSKIALKEGTRLLVWTTTPWTLPANVAIAMDPRALYVIANIRGENIILAKDRVEQVSLLLKESVVILQEFYGSELDGVYYISELEGKVPAQKELRKYHKVLAAPELVSSGEGTGLVHIAPGHGLDDYKLGLKSGLPIFCPVGPDAAYDHDAGAYSGIKVPSDANAAVLSDLKELGMLKFSGELIHSYPHCWRCHNKIIFIATPQWFLNVQKIKKKLLAINEKINWLPDEAKAWERDLFSNSPDWCISRQRYWATPMPIWICSKCGEREVIGSRKELEEKAINKEYTHSLTDLHRPYVDDVIIRCGKCGAESRRIKDVLDVWFDSGMSFRLCVSEEQFKTLFPVDFVVEYVEQIRAWFSVLMKCSLFLYGKSPLKNIAVYGILFDLDGRKLSKSIGNFTPISELIKSISADAVRIYFLNRNQIDNIFLNEKAIKDEDRTLLLLYNISNLIGEYSEAVGYVPKLKTGPIEKLDAEEVWLLSRYASTLGKVTASLDAYEPYGATSVIKRFVSEDISKFYLKAAKKRILEGGKKARSALDVINYVLFNTLIMLSPIAPFVSEGIYLDRYNLKESISLESWPKAKKGMLNPMLEKDFDVAQEAITALLNSREKADIKLRCPISLATVEVNDDEVENALLKLSGVVEDYINAKQLKVKRVRAFGKEIRPAFTKIGPEFKGDAQVVAEALKIEDADKVSVEINKNGHYPLHTKNGLFDIRPEHFSVIEKLESENAIKFDHGIAFIDTQISEELMEESMVREFERRVQIARKDAGLKKADRMFCSTKSTGAFSSR